MIQEYSVSNLGEREIGALRARIAELEKQCTELAQKEKTAREEAELLQRAIDALPRTLFIKDLRSVYLGCSQLFADHAGVAHPHDLKGKNDYELAATQEQADGFRADDQAVMKSGVAVINKLEQLRTADGRTLWLETSKVPLRNREGNVMGVVGTYEDVTLRKQQEEALVQQREDLIQAQAALVSELSTPLLPIFEKVLVMPLIGHIDQERARTVLERLLDGVSTRRAEMVILDLTGVPVVDTGVAGAVLGAARAVRLLGAGVILSGIRPELARTIVDLGLDLGGVTVCATLQAAVVLAMGLGLKSRQARVNSLY